MSDRGFTFIHRAVLCCVLNIMEFKVTDTNDYLAILFTLLGSPTFLCIMGSNVLFNLKEAGERGLNQGISYYWSSSASISAMDFA